MFVGNTIKLLLPAVFSIVFPLVLIIWWKRKTGAGLWGFAAGMLCFAVFAMVLENILHSVCLFSETPLAAFLKGSAAAYTLYGSLAAGIFEETGRLFGFRVLLKKHDEASTAVAYGIGHGGIEVILILGITYVVYCLAAAGVQIGSEEVTRQLVETGNAIPFASVFMAMFERISAMMVHIGLSMVMFTAVKEKGRMYLYPAAITLHALTDVPACLYQFKVLQSLAIVEGCTFAMGLICLFVGKTVLDSYKEPLTDKEVLKEEAMTAEEEARK